MQILKVIISFKRFYYMRKSQRRCCINVILNESYTNGLAHKTGMKYNNCGFSDTFMNTNTIRSKHDMNITSGRYALLFIGQGLEAGKTFLAVMKNQLLLTRKCRPWTSKSCLVQQQRVRLLLGVHYQKQQKKMTEVETLPQAFDNNRQKCGFKSLSEVLTVTSFDNSKGLDLKCLSNRCTYKLRQESIH